MTYNDISLDWKAREILFVIQASDGESHTSEIRQVTGFESEIIKYRFGKLEDAGLITVGKPSQLEDGRMGPTPVTITNEGQDVVCEGFDKDSAEKTLEERLRRIERRSERYKDLREAYHETKEEVEKLQDRIQLLERRIEEIE